LEAAVDVAAEVRKLEGAVGEIREGLRGGGIGKVSWKEGGTSRTEQSALMTTGVGLPGKKDGLVGRRKVQCDRRTEDDGSENGKELIMFLSQRCCRDRSSDLGC
jgi:hypothetical protein